MVKKAKDSKAVDEEVRGTAIEKAKEAKKSIKRYDEKFADLFLDAYKEGKCLIVKTCRAVGIKPDTIRRWEDNYPDFARKKKLAEMEMAENIEEHLIGNAMGKKHQGIPVTQIYYLKHNHPKYAEQQVPTAQKMEFWWVKTVQPDIKKQIKEAKVVEAKVIKNERTSGDLRTPKVAGTDNRKPATGDTRG